MTDQGFKAILGVNMATAEVASPFSWNWGRAPARSNFLALAKTPRAGSCLEPDRRGERSGS